VRRLRTAPFGRAGIAVGSILVVSGVAAVAWLVFDHRRAAQIALGRALYAERCASCHGAKLEGEPDWQTPKANRRMPAPPHDASGHTWHHSDQELHRITKLGMSAVVPGYESEMPAFAGVLSDDEIEAILNFIKSTWPAKERIYQREQSTRR
jgi:mono/diheme cytochrome c family protein